MIGCIEAYVSARLDRGEIVASSASVITGVLCQWYRFAGLPPWTEAQVAAWTHGSGMRANTRKSRLTKLRPHVRWLIAEGLLDHDPTLRIGRVVVPEGSPRDMTTAEVGSLLDVCPDERARLVVLLMVQLGLRCGDVARIRVQDIDAQRRSLHVRAKGGRGEPTHWAPIPDEAWDAVVAWLRSHGVRSGPLVCSYQRPVQGLTPATVSKLVGKWIRAAGLKEFPYDGRSPHALRHTCAQHMLDGGAEPRDVQYALGHKTLRSTELYTRREPRGLRAAMAGRTYAA